MWLWLAASVAGVAAGWACLALLRGWCGAGWAATCGPEPASGPPAWRLPRAWRCCRPWLGPLLPWCDRLLSWRMRAVIERAIVRAGCDGLVRPCEVAALSLWMAWLGGVVAVTAASLADGWRAWLPLAPAACAAGAWPALWLRRCAARRRQRIARELPFILDLMTLCAEAGLGMHGALQQAASHGPPGPLRELLVQALCDMRAGMPRRQAMQALAARADSPPVRAWVGALAHADAQGMSLGPMLRGLATRYRAERHQRAERLAMEAPVKMLLPLIACIFPCTFIVLAFPIGYALLQGGP
ncbi:type II secretion system F family protein [Bordetella bronchiseptica]|uniref:type II secretion system F family protein n=2 Tax=Bordetella bronchiseptica TaxID=518 RepID=UPI000528EDD2|nr:type II secretion system F family protein [Bordetella bronchiseptica]